MGSWLCHASVRPADLSCVDLVVGGLDLAHKSTSCFKETYDTESPMTALESGDDGKIAQDLAFILPFLGE